MSISVYTKNYCPYCVRAKNLLKTKNLSFKEIDITEDLNLQKECFSKSNGMRTVPQIFFGSFHVGGFDDLLKLSSTEKFNEILKEESII
jgi:glutaredoxin 3